MHKQKNPPSFAAVPNRWTFHSDRQSSRGKGIHPSASPHDRRREASLIIAALRYADQFVKLDGACLFSERVCQLDSGARAV